MWSGLPAPLTSWEYRFVAFCVVSVIWDAKVHPRDTSLNLRDLMDTSHSRSHVSQGRPAHSGSRKISHDAPWGSRPPLPPAGLPRVRWPLRPLDATTPALWQHGWHIGCPRGQATCTTDGGGCARQVPSGRGSVQRAKGDQRRAHVRRISGGGVEDGRHCVSATNKETLTGAVHRSLKPLLAPKAVRSLPSSP